MSWGQFLLDRAWELGLMAALLVASAFCSGSETALFSLSPGQLYRIRREGRGGRIAAALMMRPQTVLQAILLTNHIVNVAFSGIAAMFAFDLGRLMRAPAWAAALAWVAPLLVLILLGEVAPKMAAIGLAERWACVAAGIIATLRTVLSPLIGVLQRVVIGPLTRILAPRRAGSAEISPDELATLLDLSARRGIIDHQANALLQEIMELTDLRAGDIMVPRVDMVCYDVDGPRAGLVSAFRATRLRRIPVYERDVDHIVGVVHAKRALLNPDAPLRSLAVKAPFVPEAANLERVLLQLRVTRSQMAIVVDEYGGTAGLITLQDILEQIVGDIPDLRAGDRGPAVAQIEPGRYLIDGDLPIHEWAHLFEIDLGGRRISTIGGFVISLLGHIPAVGETVSYRNLQFTVVSMRGRRIGMLQVRLQEAPA